MISAVFCASALFDRLNFEMSCCLPFFLGLSPKAVKRLFGEVPPCASQKEFAAPFAERGNKKA